MSSAQHAPVGRPYSRPKRSESSPLLAVTSLFLGILVAVLGFAALFMWIDAHNARDTANRASDKVAAADSPSATSDVHAHATAAGLESYAGAAPANAAALAAAHRPFPAALPAAPAGPVANVDLVLTDITVQIAPGVKYAAWAWAGGAPGPVIHVRQGQLVKITLTNNGAIPHSVDFHAARIAPNKAFGDVLPGKSVSYTFRANDPGVFMYHCGTKPVLMHIANGMYGAIVVEPKPGSCRRRTRTTSSSPASGTSTPTASTKPAQFNMDKAHARQPDWMTFNGYAGQYVTAPADGRAR